MSSVGGGPAAVVSKSGNCKREVVIGPTTHVIMHSWRPKTGRGLELITTLVDSKHKNRPSNKMTTSVENTEHALSSAAAEMAHKILKIANQTMAKEGRLCDLWAAFEEHSKLYMAHHAIAKWQRKCHGRRLETFQDGDLVIETDFAEKYTHHQSYIGMMMPVYPQTTLMVAIVHFSPQTQLGGGRVHVTETWTFASEGTKHDCDFHLYGLTRIADYSLPAR